MLTLSSQNDQITLRLLKGQAHSVSYVSRDVIYRKNWGRRQSVQNR